MHGWICHSSFPDLQRCLRTSLPTTWNSIMAVKCPRGNSQLQEFRESDVVKWKEVLKCHSGEAFLDSVLGASNLHTQLSNFKKFSVSLLKSPDVCTREMLTVLVEVHALCASRHPLQRAIGSTLQNLPTPYHTDVGQCVQATISKVLAGRWIESHGIKMKYLETLTENFPIGEDSLKQMMPLVLEYCTSVIALCSQETNVSDFGVLIVALKATINIIHKTMHVIHALLSKETSFTGNDGEGLAIVWQENLSSAQLRKQWVESQLMNSSGVCESLLVRAASLPHDVTVAAAMLNVTLLLSQFAEDELKDNVRGMTEKWLAKSAFHLTGSPLPPFAQLAVCHALLAKLQSINMLDIVHTGKPLLLVLFPIVCQLFNSFTETGDRYIASRTLALWTTVAKDCSTMADKASVVSDSLLPSGEIVQTLLQYVWSLWEDPVDGIRHQCKTVFENVIEISHVLQSKGPGNVDFLLSLAETLLSLEPPTRGKYILLSVLTRHVSITSLLRTAPRLPEEIMGVMGHQTLACHAGELWSLLVNLHWHSLEGRVDAWCEIWVDILVHTMCTSPPVARQHAMQHCLPSLFHCTVECMTFISTALEKSTSILPENKLITKLAFLRCAKNELKGFQWEESYTDVLNVAMHHADEQIRLSTLGLLCDSHHTTEPPQTSAFPTVLQFIELNANCQSPGFRNPAINTIKKFLIRIKDSSYALQKQHHKGKAEDPTSLICSFLDFLQALLDQQFAVLHPHSSFQRRNFALSILQLLGTIFNGGDIDRVIAPVFHFPSAVSERQGRCLLHNLQDSYDSNRATTLEVLLKLPQDKIGLEDPFFLEECCRKCYRLAASPKAVDCTTAAFLTRLLVLKKCKDFNKILGAEVLGKLSVPNQDLITEMGREISEVFERLPQWDTIRILCGLLLTHVDMVQTDLVHASVVSPVYGVLQCIRAVLEVAISLYPLNTALPAFQVVAGKLVSLCEHVSVLVSPVVCSSSPEGFLPEAHLQDGGNGALLHEVSSSRQGSAQSLLLCCWHTMKEVSLLLGFLVENAPVGKEEEGGVFSQRQLNVIADIFIHQLTEARHRGAFEMAYSGFLKLCHCLWDSPYKDLHLKPVLWVKELLESLQSTSMSRLLSITRRSAGLPFYLQAILAAEPTHSGRPSLKTTMLTLLKVARNCRVALEQGNVSSDENVVPDIQPQPAAVHALNILRALYRDSRLGAYVVPFIPEGVIIAIEGFSAAFWPVRNSSTLLFSALITRIFGAKRVQDECSIENKITAKEFFSRFPSLHAFLLKQLSNAADLLETRHESILQPSLFPVLLLLSRIYPSPLDEEHSLISLKPFLPLLMRCAGCSEWKARVLNSEAMSTMANSHNVKAILEEIGKQLSLDSQNKLHGLLLVVDRVLQDHRRLLEVPQDDMPSTAHWLLDCLLAKYRIGTDQNPCGVTRCLYLKVITSVVEYICKEKTVRDISHQARARLHNVILEANRCLLQNTAQCHVGREKLATAEVVICKTKLCLLAALYSEDLQCFDIEVQEVLTRSLQHTEPLVRCHALEIINSSQKEVVSFCPHVLQLLQDEGDECVIVQIYDFMGCAVKQFGCSCLEPFIQVPNVVHTAIGLVSSPHVRMDLRISLINFLSVAFCYPLEPEYEKDADKLTFFLQELSSPINAAELRTALARALGELWKILCHRTNTAAVVSKLVVTLLQDADIEVRCEMASSVARMLSQQEPTKGNRNFSIANPNPPSALQWFVSSLVTDCEKESLLNLITIKHPSEGSDNLLFDVDPINNHAEETVLLQHVCTAIQTTPQVAVALHPMFDRIVSQLPTYMNTTCCFSPWEQQETFMHLYELVLWSNCVLTCRIDVQLFKKALRTLMQQLLDRNEFLHPCIYSMCRGLCYY